jgi:hypothetical protein
MALQSNVDLRLINGPLPVNSVFDLCFQFVSLRFVFIIIWPYIIGVIKWWNGSGICMVDVNFQCNPNISIGFCTVKCATAVSYPSDAISINDHTIYHCFVTSTSSINVKNYRANKEGMFSAVWPNVLFSVIEQRPTDIMDFANFLLRHWGSWHVVLSNCVYYLIPVG